MIGTMRGQSNPKWKFVASREAQRQALIRARTCMREMVEARQDTNMVNDFGSYA